MSISCQNLQAIWNTEITIRGEEEGYFSISMKERDKRLRTFYQTSLGERSALETRRVDMIQERQSLEGGERGLEDTAVICHTAACFAPVMLTLKEQNHYSKHCSTQSVFFFLVLVLLTVVVKVYFRSITTWVLTKQSTLTQSRAILFTQY